MMMQPIFPQPLETKNLVIRMVEPKDSSMLYEAAYQSIDTIQPWLIWAKNGVTLEAFQDFCQTKYGRYWLNEEAVVVFLLKPGTEFVGCGSLHAIDWPLRQFEIGYWCNIRYSGKGLMKEGLEALSDYAMQTLEANRVALNIDDNNHKSWRLAESAGFQLEGILHCNGLDINGHLRHTRIYAKTIAPPMRS